MNYLQKNKIGSKRKGNSSLLLIGFVFGALVILRWIIPDAFASASHFIGRPFWSVESFASDKTASIFSVFYSKDALIEENKKLSDAVQTLEADLANKKVLEARNAELEDLLGKKTNKNAVVATLIIRPPQSLYDTFILDAGKNSGVLEGDLVTFGNIALGKIVSSLSVTSEAKFLSSSGQQNDVFVGAGRIKATALGKGAGNFEIRIPKGITLTKGDAVILPGASLHVVALVQNVESGDKDAFQIVNAVVPANIFSLQSVLIEKQVLK